MSIAQTRQDFRDACIREAARDAGTDCDRVIAREAGARLADRILAGEFPGFHISIIPVETD